MVRQYGILSLIAAVFSLSVSDLLYVLDVLEGRLPVVKEARVAQELD